MSHSGLLDVAKLGLRGEVLRVLLAVLGTLDFGNVVQVSQAELGRAIGMRSQSVNRAWRDLVQHDLLRHLEMPGPLGLQLVWVVSPLLAWRGEAKHHGQAIREWQSGVGVPNAPRSAAGAADREGALPLARPMVAPTPTRAISQ
jgi:hypothetical protein